jgi:hypothetical protein
MSNTFARVNTAGSDVAGWCMTNPHDNIQSAVSRWFIPLIAADGWHQAVRLSETH